MALAFLARQPDYATEYSVSLDPELIAAMNRWRLAQTPMPTPNEAVISLIRLGLAASPVPAFKVEEDEQVETIAAQFRTILENR